MKEMIFTIVLSLFLAVFMADPVQAEAGWMAPGAGGVGEGDPSFVDNGARPMDFGSYLIFMTSLMTVLMSKMMN